MILLTYLQMFVWQNCLSVRGTDHPWTGHAGKLLLLWPWPWPDDLDIWSWPRNFEDLRTEITFL